MVDLKNKGVPAPEYGPGIRQHLQDDYILGHKSVVRESKIATTSHNMIGDTSLARFSRFIGARHFTLINRDMRFTFWLCDCLKRFEAIVKQAVVYEAI